MLKLLNAGLLMLMVSACDCGPPECFDLVWNPTTETCDCPMGTMPNYDLQVCEGVDGDVIPWSDIAPGARPIRPMRDSGTDDANVMSDAGPDAEVMDIGTQDMGDDAPDSGAVPANVRARFPWNGFTTGSPHVTSEALVVDHPLRPRLVWDEVRDADSYQVQMTRACTEASFRTCDFSRVDLDEMTLETAFRPVEPLLVSLDVPVGSRYFWRVRACSSVGCSDWSDIRYLDVGRDDHDLNGDGYGDVVVGASDQNAGAAQEGGVYVFLGGPTGTATVAIEIDNPRNQAAGHFGSSIATPGDLNGDGFPDLVVGAPGQISPATSAGSVYVFLGGVAGPSTRPDRSIDSPSGGANARFGLVAGGDVDGDGYADLIVGARGADSGGAVYLFVGGSGGVPGMPTQTIEAPVAEPEAGFGVVGVTGDINGDGFADVMVGAPGQNGTEDGAGVTYLFLGNGDGLPSSPTVTIPSPSPVAMGGFGSLIAGGGDVNGDGFADVAIAHQSAIQRIDLFAGSRVGIGTSPQVTLANPVVQENTAFGISMSLVGDVNGDGLFDLLVGASGQTNPTTSEGVAYVLLGSTGWAQNWLTVDSPTRLRFGLFGISVGSAGDVNGDGFSDVVVGTAFHERRMEHGRAYTFHGHAGGIRGTASSELDNPLTTSFVRFAWTVAP